MKKNTISRQELYDLVWKESLTAISKRLYIPYTHLRKICAEFNIPIPPNGHWSKLLFGKPVEIIELPQDYQGENEIKLYPADVDILYKDGKIASKTSTLELIKNDKSLPLKVSKRLTDPDKLIISAENSINKYPLAWWNNRGMVRTTQGHINLRVSPASISRALRFLDAFVKLLIARGHKFESAYPFTQAVIDNINFEFSLNEKNQQKTVGNSMNNKEYKPTGLFTFTIEGRNNKSWSDAKAPIEDKLAEILAKLENEAQRIKAERLIYQEQQRIIEEQKAIERKLREEQERLVREEKERIEKERSDFQDLYKQSKRWHRARIMRDYIKAVEEKAVEKSGLTDEVQSWLRWANDKVDWYDPLVNNEKHLIVQKK
ncbi:MAG: hypothetical protein WCR72_18140 [Bacteroidota bacterium]